MSIKGALQTLKELPLTHTLPLLLTLCTDGTQIEVFLFQSTEKEKEAFSLCLPLLIFFGATPHPPDVLDLFQGHNTAIIAKWFTASAFPLENSLGHYEGFLWLCTTEDRNVDVMFDVKNGYC